MGTNGSTGPEAVAAAEKNAAILTAKAGARDPSAIPSICRISAALQTTSYCLNVAAEQEKIVMEKWLPELKAAILSAQKCLEGCNYVRGLLDEWWEQPAATVVDWVQVDRLNVAAWHNHVKQLLAFYDQEHLPSRNSSSSTSCLEGDSSSLASRASLVQSSTSISQFMRMDPTSRGLEDANAEVPGCRDCMPRF
ncbi:hypothetical protein ACFX1R_047520 [Malus domestica]